MVTQETVSRVIFGNAAFLAVAQQIMQLEHQEFTSREIHEPWPGTKQPVYRRLVNMDMLEVARPAPRQLLYIRLESPWWEVIEAARVAMLQLKRGQTWQPTMNIEDNPFFWMDILPEVIPVDGVLNREGVPLMMLMWAALRGQAYYDTEDYRIETDDSERSSPVHYLAPLKDLGMVGQVYDASGWARWSRLDSPLWLIAERWAEIFADKVETKVKPKSKVAPIELPPFPELEAFLRPFDHVPVRASGDRLIHHGVLEQRAYQAFALRRGIVRPVSEEVSFFGAKPETICGKPATSRADNLASITCGDCLKAHSPWRHEVIERHGGHMFKVRTAQEMQVRYQRAMALFERAANYPILGKRPRVSQPERWPPEFKRWPRGQAVLLHEDTELRADSKFVAVMETPRGCVCAFAHPWWRIEMMPRYAGDWWREIGRYFTDQPHHLDHYEYRRWIDGPG